MGGKSSKSIVAPIADHWNKIGELSNAALFENVVTHELGEERLLPLDPRRDFSKQAQIYAYRRDYHGPLVRTLAVEKLAEEKKSMCGKSDQARVITERIPQRWNEIRPLQYSETVYALSQSLKGYEDLYEKVGPFQVTPLMMGVNNTGEMKVWLNQNFAENHPSNEKPILQTTSVDPEMLQKSNSSQSYMVQNIAQIVESKCSSGKYPTHLGETVYNNTGSFEQARIALDHFIKSSNLYLPSKLNTEANTETAASIVPNSTNNNIHRYTMQNNNESVISPRTNIISSTISQPQPYVIRTMSPRVISHSPRINYSPRTVYHNPPQIHQKIVISKSPQTKTRFTYHNPIQTSQVTHRYY